MPTLIKNYQKHVLVNQLKRTVSVLEQGYQKMLADEGVDSLKHVPGMWEGDCQFAKGLQGPSDEQWDCTSFVEQYQKYFNGTLEKAKAGYVWNFMIGEVDGDMEDTPLYILNDGTILKSDISERLYIDVNGYRGPNMYGRDIFTFGITENGHIVPITYLSSSSCGKNMNDGESCFRKIVEDGWKMNY